MAKGKATKKAKAEKDPAIETEVENVDGAPTKKADKGKKGKGKNKIESMDDVIETKLNQKIKEQLNEINELQETINKLKDGQPIFANDAEIRLEHLHCSASEMNVMADELSKLRGTAGNLQVETELIYSKFDDTTVKISASLSKLQNKVTEHATEQAEIGNDLEDLKKKIMDNQTSLEYDLAENQRKINEQLEELKTKLNEAIEASKQEAISESKCCTIL